MERGLDQLIFFAFIVLAALVDFVVRTLKNRGAPRQPPAEEELDVEEEFEEDWRSEPGADWRREPGADWRSEPAPDWRTAPAPEPAPLPEPAWQRVPERSADQVFDRVPEPIAERTPERIPERIPEPVAWTVVAPAPALPRAALRLQRAARREAAPGARVRGRGLAGLLSNRSEARRAMILLAVLGPCRALEPQRRNVP